MRFSIAKLPQNRSGVVRNLTQRCKAEKTAHPLDGMHRPKDAGQQLGVVRVRLQLDPFPVQPGQIFAALDEKIANDFLFVHFRGSASSCRPAGHSGPHLS